MKKIIALILILIPSVSFAQVPDFPMAFWGNVTVDGALAQAGSIVRVYDDRNTMVGEAIVQENGVYGYTEPTKQKLILGEGEGELTFSIQSPSVRGGVETEGLILVTYPAFNSGETVEFDLGFETVPEVVQEPRRSSGGGGGGGSRRSRAEETPAAQVLGVATSTENLTEEELKIELQKQLILILTQLITLLQQKIALQ